MAAQQQVVRTTVVMSSPERVWRAITDETVASRWMGGSVRWDLRPGGRGSFAEPARGLRHLLVSDVVPHRRLAFESWPATADGEQPTEVSIELAPTDGGTEITVTERALAANRASAELSEAGV